MGWQEELRQLDVELANGRITPESHRKQRDELLAVASGGGAPSPVASPLHRPQSQQGQPAPQWQSANPGHQVTEPATPPPTHKPQRPTPAQPFTTDRRTTAPSPADERHTDWLPYPIPAAGRFDSATVVRPAVLPPPPPQTAQSQSQQESQRRSGHRRSDPTIPPPRKNRGTPVWLFIALGVVLVGALVAGGMWWIDSTRDNTVDTGATSLDKSLPVLPGTAGPNNSTVSVYKALDLRLIGQHTADLMNANHAQEITFRSSAEMADQTYSYTLFVVKTPSSVDATNLAEDLTQYAETSGFTDMQLADAPARSALSVESPQGTLGQSWYSSANLTVGVGISQLPSGDAALLRERVAKTRNQLIGVLPRG